jgi:hypothetical protein
MLSHKSMVNVKDMKCTRILKCDGGCEVSAPLLKGTVLQDLPYFNKVKRRSSLGYVLL